MFYSPGWPPGRVSNGIVTYVGSVRHSLAESGVDVSVVTSAEMGDGPSSAIDVNALRRSPIRKLILKVVGRYPRVASRGAILGWTVAEAVNRIADTRRVDVLEMEETFGAAWYAQQVLDIPVVVRLHGPHFLNGTALGLPTDGAFNELDGKERRCITEAVGVTSPSRDVLDRVRERYGLPLANARVIPNPAPVIPLEQRWRLEASDRKTILFVGRFDRHKGGDIVIDAFGRVARAVPEAQLVLVGPDRGLRDDSGRTWKLSEYLSDRLQPADRARVRVTGALDSGQIEQFRRQSFVTVVASRYENFPMALAESLALGCPTVGSRVGGIPEILLDGRTGLLFQPGDATDLAARLQELFADPERAAAMGEQAARDTAVRFSPVKIARETLDYYEGVLGKRPPSTPGRTATRALFRATDGWAPT